MSNVTLNWRERNDDATGTLIYRSTTPMDVNDLPEPIAELEQGVEQWEDTETDAYTSYYYRVAAVRDTTKRVSREIEVPAVPSNMGVGPDELIGGDLRKAGFFGEVLARDFITGDELASHIGLTSGSSQHSDTEWLKFCLDGEIIFIPKKPHRYFVSWNHINNAGAVYESQNTTVTIGEDTYRVTLLRGANQDPVPSENGYDLWWTHGSEWNRLMYPIHSGVHTDSLNPSNPSEPYNQWASYSDADLELATGSGSASWTQESEGGNRLHRGGGGRGVTSALRNSASRTYAHGGWRSALRLVR